jgi:hypothetical protein
MSKEKTVDEMREEFLSHVRTLIKYWDEVDGPDSPKTTKDRLAGLAFSILVTLDGGAADIPGYLIIPNSSEEDKGWYKQQGEDYYPIPPQDIKGDIGGFLHELLKM